MDIVPLIHALILGIVEGLTEFLPVSSTGHLIVVGDLIHFNDEKGKVFEIVIQFGAILAVVWEYRAKILQVVMGLRSDRTAQRFALNLMAAFMPAAVLGLLFSKAIKAHLFQPIPVATAFIIGAFIILWAEKRKHRVRIENVDELRIADAFMIGLAQSLALIPGTSRSGATIIGGLLIGMSRTAATEFSFFLAIPTLTAATGYEIFKNRALFSADDIGIFSVGFVTSFVAAFLCVRWLLRYVSHHDFTPFAWYRIAFGLLILATWQWGLVDWSNP